MVRYPPLKELELLTWYHMDDALWYCEAIDVAPGISAHGYTPAQAVAEYELAYAGALDILEELQK